MSLCVDAGDAQEFVQALYSVGRDFRVGESSTDRLGFSSPSAAGFRSTSEDDSDTSAGRQSRLTVSSQ